MQRKADGAKRTKDTALRKIMLILACFVCGSLLFMSRRYGLFRVREISVRPFGIIPCAAVWDAVPDDVMSFWPSLLFDTRGIVMRTEGFYPVRLALGLSGWGRIVAEVEPLVPEAYVSWNSRTWLLDRSGRIWPSDLQTNRSVKGMSYPSRPILSWDASLPLPFDPDMQGGDIYKSGIPFDKIERWYEAIGAMKWADSVMCLIAKKSEGRPIVQILLGNGQKVTSEIILNEDTSDWLYLAEAIDRVFPDGEYISPPGMIINAAYSDLMFSVTQKNSGRAGR